MKTSMHRGPAPSATNVADVLAHGIDCYRNEARFLDLVNQPPCRSCSAVPSNQKNQPRFVPAHAHNTHQTPVHDWKRKRIARANRHESSAYRGLELAHLFDGIGSSRPH